MDLNGGQGHPGIQIYGYVAFSMYPSSCPEKCTYIYVLFVDDLDRCPAGRNVKVLEAMTLLLSVPGAPVIAFMAIDSRMVVASIEESFGAVLRDAYISGLANMASQTHTPTPDVLQLYKLPWQPFGLDL